MQSVQSQKCYDKDNKDEAIGLKESMYNYISVFDFSNKDVQSKKKVIYMILYQLAVHIKKIIFDIW